MKVMKGLVVAVAGGLVGYAIGKKLADKVVCKVKDINNDIDFKKKEQEAREVARDVLDALKDRVDNLKNKLDDLDADEKREELKRATEEAIMRDREEDFRRDKEESEADAAVEEALEDEIGIEEEDAENSLDDDDEYYDDYYEEDSNIEYSDGNEETDYEDEIESEEIYEGNFEGDTEYTTEE